MLSPSAYTLSPGTTHTGIFQRFSLPFHNASVSTGNSGSDGRAWILQTMKTYQLDFPLRKALCITARTTLAGGLPSRLLHTENKEQAKFIRRLLCYVGRNFKNAYKVYDHKPCSPRKLISKFLHQSLAEKPFVAFQV